MSDEKVPGKALEEKTGKKTTKRGGLYYLLRFFEGVSWLSDRAMSFLRLFAVVILFSIVVNLVYRAVRNADVVVVKPFSVPQSLSANNAQAGRIIANFLKQDLKRKEQQFNASMKGSIRNSSIASLSDQQLESGANIKLPQTGISINDVVDFISTLFGKQSISGTVYEDDKRLYLQLELQGRVLSFEQPLVEGVSRLKLLEEMLSKQSSKKLLSVAFEDYNLFYYCDGEVSTIEQHSKKYEKWFTYCQNFRLLKDEKGILALKQKVNSTKNQKLAEQDRLIAHVLTSIKHSIQDKENLLTLAKQKKANQLKLGRAMMASVIPAPVSMPVTSAEPGEHQQEQDQAKLIIEALTRDSQKPEDNNESERKIADALLLYKLGLYEDAVKKYEEAIRANNRNPVAWANLGLLYAMSEDKKYQDYSKAKALINKAISLKPKLAWLYHSLCIVQAYSQNIFLAKKQNFETLLSTIKSCQKARSLEPSKTVLYDKLFYIAMADKLYENKQYSQAYETYQKCLRIDQRADCHMYDVIEKLRKLDKEKKVKGAGEYACKVLLEKAYFIEKQPSECEDDLRLWQSECE